MRSTERSAGFTLLEVLIALVVFTTVMGALLSTVSQSVRALGDAEREVELMELARDRMRQVQLDSENGSAPPPPGTRIRMSSRWRSELRSSGG